MISIRGAITTNNCEFDIINDTQTMLKEVLLQNEITIKDIVSIIFTATKDLDAAYPARAARALGITEASLLCMQEMHVADALPFCIRLLVHCNSALLQNQVKHVYLKDAVSLRLDIRSKNEDQHRN